MTDESWRAHVDRELAHQSEKFGLKLDALVAQWRLQSRTLRRALKLQAKEYERRLEVLNHENARVKAASDLSVPREKYDADRAGDKEAIEMAALALQTAKDEMRTDMATRAGAAQFRGDIKSYIAIALALISLLLKFLPLGGAP